MRHLILGFGMMATLAACGDPLQDVARLSDVEVSQATRAVAPTAAEVASTGGLLDRLLNRDPDDPTTAAVDAAVATAEQANATRARAVRPARWGLLGLFGGGRAAARTGPDTSDVSPGAVLPFGEIARVCDVGGDALGTLVDQGGGFQIYDTIPNSKAPRPFYITGFDDRCARTFTGAVVISGDVETHEFVRYRPSNQGIGYTATDNAYEALKASYCRVGQGVPCGAKQGQLNQSTRFVTVYNFFGGTFSSVPTEWAQILLHGGEVVAMSIKDGDIG
ncbi:hypothetical protein [Thalassorhabdomicrobium marinisediminis]|uniref:hypothetical protein n=1 Tax=Thalassorhabdomicrobium marinisediminis TaxID=2170577 RepID=UPI002492A2EA|nr:hypothetical protein [Thalassorhabdomicrobium marinisediminis]